MDKKEKEITLKKNVREEGNNTDEKSERVLCDSTEYELIEDKGKVFEKLIHLANKNSFQVKFCDFQAYNGLLRRDRIGIRATMTIEEINYSLAHELAHHYLHFDCGDTINSPLHAEYEKQADRAAKMLLDAVAVI